MSTEDTLEKKLEEVKKLNRQRFDFVLAFAKCHEVVAALEKIGRSSGWYYTFSQEERTYLESLGDELHKDKALQAFMMLQEAAPDAAQVRVDGLKSNNEWVKQNAAGDILDRTVGKVAQKSKIELEGNMNIQSEQMEKILQKVYGNRPSNP